MDSMIYLDWASTTPPDAGILVEAADIASRHFGNPSSAHRLGKEAREKLEEARAGLVALLGPGAKRGRLVFTGSGTEADGIPLLALLRKAAKDGSSPHVVLSGIEHAAIHEELLQLGCMGVASTRVNPDPDGRMSPKAVAAALRPETELVCVMAVNNETGAVQPLREIVAAIAVRAAEAGRKRPRILVDAVQALGKIAFPPAELGVDYATFSAHKVRGPRGAGALWLARDIEPLVVGGGQEGGTRPGTESLQAAWGFFKAAKRAVESIDRTRAKARTLEELLIAGLEEMGAQPLPAGRRAGDERYSPFILSAAFPGISGEVLARALAGGGPGTTGGIAVSTGSACSANAHKKGRRVLEAMGLAPGLALSAIRVSIGELSEAADIEAFLTTARSLHNRLRV